MKTAIVTMTLSLILASAASAAGPVAITRAATNVWTTSATLNGILTDDSGGYTCSAQFRYREVGTSTWTETAWAGSLHTNDLFSTAVTGLTSGTQYEYQCRARLYYHYTFLEGPWSSSVTFKTTTEMVIPKPVAVATGPTNIQATSATLNGQLTEDYGTPCQVRFRYRRTGTSTWTETAWAGSYTEGQTFSVSIADLASNTQYEYRCQAKFTTGLLTEGDWSGSFTFMTIIPAGLPVVVATGATDTQATSATLNGRLIKDYATPCQARFRYRRNATSTWTETAWVGSYRESQTFSALIVGLTPGTPYEYQCQGQFAWDTGLQLQGDWSASATFTTLTVSTGPGGGTGPVTGLPTPVAHWALDETSGTTATDSAGSHNGQLRGGPVWQPSGGVFDGALRFDGIDDYVDCGTFNPSVATGKLTVCLWAKWNGLTDWFQVLIAKRDAWDAGQMMWQLESALDTGTVGFFRDGSGSSEGFVLPVGEWTHVAATCDGATAKLYRDGQQVTSGPMTFGSDTAARVVFGACQSNGENPFKGLLDDVRLYDQVLSADQIRAVMGTIHWMRAVYWDTRYPTSWVEGSAVRDALASAGYEVLNADQLASWMDARILDGKPSVVVFCQDLAPDTVYEMASPSCTLREYLDAGGKIVWYGDIPLYYQGHSDGIRTSFGVNGSVNVLGFNAAGGVWDRGDEVTITQEGHAWGLTQTWVSGRPAKSAGLQVLAQDSAGQAAAWVKHFVPGDAVAGFVRLSDTGAIPNIEDVRRLAEYPNPVVVGEGLVAHWKLDGDATDRVGTSDGTVHGNPIWTTGKVGGALRLDGSGDYVDCGNQPALNLTSGMTVAAWVNVAAVTGEWHPIIAKGNSAWRLSTLLDQRKLHFAVGGAPEWPAANSVGELTMNRWHHVAGTYDGSVIRLYIDGVLDSTAAYTGVIWTNAQPVFIGENSERMGSPWEGLIDEVRIYNRALTAAEVAALATP